MLNSDFPFSPQLDLQGKNLLMVGVCLRNSIGCGKGPELHYATPDQLRQVKLPHPEVAAHLQKIAEQKVLDECWIWNTCNRFEVYAITQGDPQKGISFLEETFFRPLHDSENTLNRLAGVDAIHHLMRTTVGLNSGLPGETDVEQQLQVAVRIAECTGNLSNAGLAFVENLISQADRARGETAWADFSPSYCLASLEGAFTKMDRHTALSGPIVIIGSSSTTRSCVEHLEQDFGVDPDQITFFHRCHKSNGTVKAVRRASMGCHRKKVDDYNSEEVFSAIGRATLVIWGIDRDKPVLEASKLHDLRKGNSTPLAMLDFNTLGSTSGVTSSEKLTFLDAQTLEAAVRAYAEKMEADPGFWCAVDEVESHIAECVRTENFFTFSSQVHEHELAGAVR